MKESIVQQRIKNYLEINGWTVIKLIQTSMNGIPDLVCLKGGHTFFVEVKQPGKKPSDLQAYRIDKLKKAGFDTVVAHDLNDVINYFSLTV